MRAPYRASLAKLVPALVAAALALTCANTAHAQRAHVVIHAPVRRWMEATWDSTDARQPERGGCLVWAKVVTPQGVTEYHALSIVEAGPRYATPYSVAFSCELTQARWHTHTPTTCTLTVMGGVDLNTCQLGGADAYVCEPSPADYTLLNGGRVPFALVQCDKHSIVPYYRSEDPK